MGYLANAGCTNCGHTWKADISEGTARTVWEKTAKCPKCKVSGKIWTTV